jgi:hypothetical protein
MNFSAGEPEFGEEIEQEETESTETKDWACIERRWGFTREDERASCSQLVVSLFPPFSPVNASLLLG